jgi:ankyrin repeat protein
MPVLVNALHRGNPRDVEELIERGADVRYRREHGYNALLDAIHGRDIRRDARLIDLLKLLIANGVDLNAVSSYAESGLRVLSRVGRFDAVRLLLDAGADRTQLGWTTLMAAVALGSLGDVELELAGADLEARDWWQRTAWLIALLTGDLRKAQLLFEHGVNPDAVGRCAQPALFYAVEGGSAAMVQWLMEIGADVDQMDQFGCTALMFAAEQDEIDSLDALIRAGADIDRDVNGTALNRATTARIARRLLDAGADPATLGFSGRRALLGLPPDESPELMTATPSEFRRAATRRFGASNPERMDEPFWTAMIRSGLTAYDAGTRFGDPLTCPRPPIWSARRFGQSLTFLDDGRIVQIGGEHEDFYDPDFCIYNDVFVHAPDSSVTIFGYPEDVFPPTDFHTATLVDDGIFIIGRLGYQGTRAVDETRVYRLDLNTFAIERVEISGDNPGWIHGHRAARAGNSEIRVWGGTNPGTFVLDIRLLRWRRD